MRKFYSFMVAALAVMAAASCNKELQKVPQNSDKEIVTFTAFVDGADTKTILDGKVSKWESGDAITILNGSNTSEFTTQDEGVSASFTGTALSGDKFFAVYPAEYDNHEYSAYPEDKAVIAHIPVSQTSREYSYSKEAAVAVAYTENQTLEFKNATALLKFTIKGTDVKEVIFYGHNGEAVSGDVEIALAADNSIASVTGLTTDITENGVTESKLATWAKLWADYPEDDYCFKEKVTYYMAVIPQNYENGFSVQFKFANDAVADVKKLNSEKELKPNVIYDLGELEYIAPETTSTVYLKPCVWEADNAWFAAHFWGVGGNADVRLTAADEEGIYEVEVPEGMQSVLFCRMNPEYTEFGWDVKEEEEMIEHHVWNQTGDLIIPEGNVNCLVITGWESWEWMTLDDAVDYVYVAPEDRPLTMEIRGSWDEWAEGVAMTEDGDYFVIKGRSFEKGTKFKFLSSRGNWYGVSGAVSIDTELPVGGDDITIPSGGTYDLYIANTLDKFYIMTSGKKPVQPDASEYYRFYVQDKIGWGQLYFYAWGNFSSAGWPGNEMIKSANVDGYGNCKYIEIKKGLEVVNFIINNGSGTQTKDLAVSGNIDVKTLANGDLVYVLTAKDIK